MAIKTEQVEKNLVKITFEVSAEEFDKATDKVYLKNKNKYSIPGFRKGKVPKAMVEKFYSKAVFYDEAINLVLPDAYESAVKESGLDVVARPEIDIEGDIEDGKAVVFTALVTTKPEVTLGEYKGIEIDKIEYTVGKEEVGAELDKLRNQNARIVTVERAVKKGDICVIDFDGSVDGVAFDGGKGENYELEIGSNTFIPGFEDQLIGKKTGSEVDVNVTFPEEYHAENLAGKPALFKVKINEVKVRELPKLDDDFASEVSEFETLTEFKKSIKKKLQAEAAEKAKAEMENIIVDKVVENATFELPEAMIEEQIDRQVNDFAQRLQYQGLSVDQYLGYLGTDMAAFRENFRTQAVKTLSSTLVIEAVMVAEGIETGAEEYELNLVDMAKKYNMELDKLKQLISDAEAENMKKDMAMGKTVDMLVNKAKIKKPEKPETEEDKKEEKPKKTAAKKTAKKED